jgi:hypothetical protein
MLSLATRMMTVGIDCAQLAFTGGEIAVASATVIAERVGMMAVVASDPIGADYGEFDRMISEKIVAFTASGAALSDEWWRSQRSLGSFLFDLGGAMMSQRPPSPLWLRSTAAPAPTRDASAARGAKPPN